MTRFSSGRPTIDGNNLLNAKNAANDLYGQMRGPERAALKSATGVFDDIIRDELSTNVAPSAASDLARYKDLMGIYSNFAQVAKAARAARGVGGQFTPRQLSAAARDTGPINDLAQAAQGTIGQPRGGGYPWIGKIGAVGLGLGLHTPVATGAAIGGANVLATETIQRAVMGDTAAQKAIQALIAAHPNSVAAIQTIVRNVAANGAVGHQP